MPTYGYKCTECNHDFEVFQRITEDPVKVCEKCGGQVRKLLFPVGIVFKGPGFHVNDYGKSSSTSSSGGNGSGKHSVPEKKLPEETKEKPSAAAAS